MAFHQYFLFRLTFLDLSHNMLLSNDSMINKETDLNEITNKIYENAFQTKLETIVLNFCNISWTTISSIFPYFNSLKELHCCGNGIKLLENSSFKSFSFPCFIAFLQKHIYLNILLFMLNFFKCTF